MVSIWRLAGLAEFRKTKSTPEREAMFSKVIGSACGVPRRERSRYPPP
jgi:hypothetical protein